MAYMTKGGGTGSTSVYGYPRILEILRTAGYVTRHVVRVAPSVSYALSYSEVEDISDSSCAMGRPTKGLMFITLSVRMHSQPHVAAREAYCKTKKEVRPDAL